jgi:hypothetical protein
MSDAISPEEPKAGHFHKHKTKYAVATTAVVSAAATVAVMKLHGNPALVNKITNVMVFGWKSSQTTVTNNIIKAKIHPGYITRCLETGHDFASRREAGMIMNLDPKEIAKQIKGLIPDVQGYHFADGGVNLNGLK